MKKLLIIALLFMNTSCFLKGKSFDDVFSGRVFDEVTTPEAVEFEKTPLKKDNTVVVCRAKQCAPAKISMSKEYVYNSLLQLFENNNKSTALICQASPNSHSCIENYITVPIKVGVTPANMYVDSVKISDVTIAKGKQALNVLLNYNLTFNGQSPDCTTASAMIYARSSEHVVMEDNEYTCQMTAVGRTNVSTVFAIDYIDLDYGFIGGYYSIGLSGPAYGGGVGYMLITLMNDAYPLSPVLMQPEIKKEIAQQKEAEDTSLYGIEINNKNAEDLDNSSRVQVFPISKK